MNNADHSTIIAITRKEPSAVLAAVLEALAVQVGQSVEGEDRDNIAQTVEHVSKAIRSINGRK